MSLNKILYILIATIMLTGNCFATELKGGVSFDTRSARQYIQEGLVGSVDISKHPYFEHTPNVEKIVYSYDNTGEIIAATVQYIDEPSMAYIYGRDNSLIYIDKYDRPVNQYPHRGYRYNMNGELELTSLTVSPYELFRFTPTGKLLVHSINGIMYNEKGNKIGKAREK